MQARMRRAMLLLTTTTMVILALMGCGGGSAQEESKARPLPEEQQALRPGTYSSEEFKPSLSFSVGEGWTNSPPEASDALLLTWGKTAGLGFTNIQEVYKPTRTGLPNVVDAPKDMVGWFQQHPYLQTDKPEPVTVGGVKGERFDVIVEDLPEDYSGVCGVGCVGLFRLSTGSLIGQSEENKARLIVLEDVTGETVTIGFASAATEFDEFAPEAQKVLDSVEWKGI